MALPTPQLGFNDLGDMDYGRMHRFLAYPRRNGSQNRMMIRVKRDHFALGLGTSYPYPTDSWQIMFDSNSTGAGVDAFAPVMHISPGRVYDEGLFPLHALDEHGLVGLLYREVGSHGSDIHIRTAHSNESGDPLTWQVDTSSTSYWTVTTGCEFRQGLTAEPRCMDPDDCPDPEADILWFGAWTDERTASGAQVWGGTYEN